MNSNTKGLNVYKKIKDNITVADAAKALNIKLKKCGHSLQGECPTRHPSSGGRCLSINTKKDFFKCFHCGIKGDAISLVMAANKCSPKEAVIWLNQKFSILSKDELEEFMYPNLSGEEIALINEQKEKSMLYEEAYQWMHELLFQEVGKDALSYLIDKRGYDENVLKETEWCYYPKINEIKEYLKDIFPDAYDTIDELIFYGGLGDNFRLAFPYRDIDGNIKGFVKRALAPKGITVKKNGEVIENQRWDSSFGLTKTDLFNLHSWKNSETLLIVEGYPDALYLSKVGVEGIVAVGQGNLAEDHLEGLKRKKVKNVIIAFDNDEVGPGNTEKAVRLLLEKSSVTPFVLDPKKLDPHKDPDEYVKANGIDAFNNLVNEKSELGVSWLCRRIASLGCQGIIKKKKSLDDCLTLLSYVNDPVDLNKLIKQLTKDLTYTEKEIKLALEKKEEEQRIEQYAKIKDNKEERYFAFFEKKSGDYAYYDRQEDQIYLGTSKDKLRDILCSAQQLMPKVMKVLKAEFNVYKNERLNFEQEAINLFVPTKYMMMSKTDDEILPEKHFPTIDKLLRNLFVEQIEREHFINWLSGIIQLRVKQRTAWVLKGSQGAGKGIFLSHILSPLFGEEQVIKAENSDLNDNFNGWMQNKLIVAFNEVANDKRQRDELNSKIKAIVTDEQILVNEKHLRKFKIKNHASYFFFSNEFSPITLETKDRRFNIVVTGEDLMQQPWFSANPDKVIYEMKEELTAFAQYLWNWNCDSIKADIPLKNEAKENMLISDMNPYEELVYRLKQQDIEWLTKPIKEDTVLVRKFSWQLKNRAVCKDTLRKIYNGMNMQYVSEVEFGKKMTSYGLDGTKKRYTEPGSTKQNPVYVW